ncbi:MAG: hypothetical protein IPL61_06700 [Myxococcales bacterium]|nr:hypothetical protein [Myxococcales bacterium]
MTAAIASEHAVRRVRLEWEPAEHLDRKGRAVELAMAFATVTEGWIELLAVEAAIRGADGRSSEDVEPTIGACGLVRADVSADVNLDRLMFWRAHAWTRRPVLDRTQLVDWATSTIELGRPSLPVGAPTLTQLGLRACWTRVPPSWADRRELELDTDTRHLRLPLQRRTDGTWAAPPSTELGLHSPVSVEVYDFGDYCQVDLAVYWSPWADEPDRPGSDMHSGITQLVAQGWTLLATP